MQPEARQYLLDIRNAALQIQQNAKGYTLERFKTDDWFVSAVNWKFTIIGEAMNRLRLLDPTIADRISEWRRIVAFRNQLVHGYANVQNEITWRIIESKLDILIREASTVLGE